MSKKSIYGRVGAEVVRDPSIPAGPKALYSVLTTYADLKGCCFPGVKTLADSLGVSTRTVTRWMDQLQERQIISRIAIKGEVTHTRLQK